MKQYYTLGLLLLILIVATVLRGYQLEARSLWFDEAFSWRLVTFSVTEMIERDIADVHPPLYYVVLKVWTTVFGRSVVALRSFSVLLGVVTVALIYGFTRYAFRSRASGLLAALLCALASIQAQIAWEARMYTLGTALAVLTVWLLLRVIREERPRWLWAVAYGVSVALFAYTHYYALFSLAAQAIFIVGYLVVATRGRIGEILQWRLTWRLVAAGIIAVALFAPWVPHFLQQNAQVQDAFWIPRLERWSIPDTAYRMFIPTFNLPRFQGGWLTVVSLLPFIGVVAIFGWLALRSLWQQTAARLTVWLVLTCAILPIGISVLVSLTGQSLYQDRYLVFSHVFIVIAVAVFVTSLRPWWLQLGLCAVVASGMLAADIHYVRALDIPHKPGVHAATQAIFRHDPAAPLIISGSPFVFFPVVHYVQEEFKTATAVKLYNETDQLIHFAGGPILRTDDTVGPAIFAQPTPASLWIVDTTGFGGTPLTPPLPWRAGVTETFPEVFGYQGTVTVTQYSK